MKKLLTILVFIYASGCSKAQYFNHLLGDGVTSHVASSIKNIRVVDSSAIARYEFAGFSFQNNSNKVTHIYSYGTGHTTGGVLVYRTFNIAAQIWSDTTVLRVDSIHVNGAYGGKMDNDSVAIFFATQHTTGSGLAANLYIQKCDLNNHFSAAKDFDWTGIEHIGGIFYGPMFAGDVSGEYYMMLYQTAASRYKISCIKTTDYWNNYSEVGVVHDGPLDYSETAGANLGGGNFLALARKNNAGSLTSFESTNSGATWVRRNVFSATVDSLSNQLYHYLGGLPEIPFIDVHDGMFDISFQSRDAQMILMSKDNVLSSRNFGTPFPRFNAPEIYAHHLGIGGNPSLGYVHKLRLTDGRWFVTYYKQYTNSLAQIQWTLDDLVTDPGDIPDAPPLTFTASTTTTLTMTINYTDKQWENVRYLVQDLSTDASFSSFVTCDYRSLSFPQVSIHNIRLNGNYDTYSSLTSGTLYHLRVKACNNKGCSAWTEIQDTTD